MAQYSKIESLGSIGPIISAIMEVQVHGAVRVLKLLDFCPGGVSHLRAAIAPP